MTKIDNEEYNILHEEDGYLSFWLLVYYISHWNPQMKIHEVYKHTYMKLEKLNNFNYIEVVEIQWEVKDGVEEEVQRQRIPLNIAKMVLNKAETWDRLVSNGSPSFQLSITELGSSAMDIYENENTEND